jgi:hypothetical protein
MEFRLATPDDDDAIRQLLREIPLKGMIRIRYMREPSFLESINIQGVPNFTVLGTVNQKVMAMASLNVQKLNFCGKLVNTGYISNLRFHPDVRHGISLLKGIRFFEEQTAGLDIDFHYGTLIDKDEKVKKILSSNRARMPYVYDGGRINTWAVPLHKKKRKLRTENSFKFSRVDKENWHEACAFLESEGCNTDFFPEINESNYSSTIYKMDHFYVVYQENKIHAICNAVDLQRHKQYTIEGYSRSFSLFRPFLNLWLYLRKFHGIPAKSMEVNQIFLGFIFIKNNNCELFKFLLDQICAEFSGSSYHFVTLAFHELNPLNKSLEKRTKIGYTSRLYLVKLKYDKFTRDELNLKKGFPYIDILRL